MFQHFSPEVLNTYWSCGPWIHLVDTDVGVFFSACFIMNGSSVFGLFFLVETLSNTLRGSKKTRENRSKVAICVSFLMMCDSLYFWWPMTLRKWEKMTFIFFPESYLFNLLVLGGFLWFMMVCFFYVWLLVIEEVWESDMFFSSWFRKLARYGWWNSTLCPNDLDVVPMTWMLSQWLGCCPRWGNIQNCRSCCTQCFNLKIWCRFAFRWHVQKGEEKTSQHIPKKKPGGHFFGPGDGNPRISLYVISKTSCITYVYEVIFIWCSIHIICQN